MRLSLAFSHGRPSTEDEEVETFGPRLQFSAETPVATLGPVFLDQPLPQANEQTVAVCVLGVEDVAQRRGYADASSFIYAFKRWKGMTPAAYVHRNALRGRPGR